MNIRIRVLRKGETMPAMAKQLAYAAALAMNRTLEEGQEAQRNALYGTFRMRGTNQFFSNMVKIRPEDRARRDRLVARLRIEGPESDLAKGNLLARHEAGGQRSTGQGGASVDPSFRLRGMFYLPTPQLRPSFDQAIPRRLYPANLGLTARRDVSGTTAVRGIHRTWTGKTQLKGKDRTFVLFSNTGKPWGIFQRIGTSSVRYARNKAGFMVRRDDGTRDPNIKRIWRFQPTVTLKPRLNFQQRMTRVVNERYPLNFNAFLGVAIRSAK